ncbi:hypothetical protein M413DRAFT_355753 [Hebeloma cylindrosporum]|uniref:Uncharacterized protein n=1 Tax=Hebeloma cylindrosporum TaxID=76867 RepID=A0A0C2YU51_HEBCY|nr:hypothetical protein M413DRAFT_355753 [Hebeloma cylindrosporum h7]
MSKFRPIDNEGRKGSGQRRSTFNPKWVCNKSNTGERDNLSKECLHPVRRTVFGLNGDCQGERMMDSKRSMKMRVRDSPEMGIVDDACHRKAEGAV